MTNSYKSVVNHYGRSLVRERSLSSRVNVHVLIKSKVLTSPCRWGKGLSVKYVMLFLTNVYPSLSPVTNLEPPKYVKLSNNKSKYVKLSNNKSNN